ncbi:MAG TPA: hypothetical protein V6C89_17140 [Drouetiella sp.]|jgi:hypothetical protein
MRVPECLTTVGVAAFSCTVFMLPPFLLSQTVAYAAAAVAGTANATEAAIAQLEDKLYEHKYPNETDDARLSRIEKFVFGAAQTGTVAERLQRLQNSITSQANAIDKPPAVNAQSSSSSSQSTAGQSSSASASAPSDAVTVSSTFDSANYPRVTELEKDMLNATYVHEPLAQRLSRLEAKAFGAPSKSNDLCERVDNLDEYAETHKIFKNHKDPLNSSTIASSSSAPVSSGRSGIFSNSFLGSRSFTGSSDSFDDDNPPASPKPPVNPFVDGVTGTDRRLSAMEEFVYGHNYATKPVQDRLERLEKRLVPYQHNLAQKDVTYRVNNIWNILSVANTFNSAPTAAHPANTAAAAAAAHPASTVATAPTSTNAITAPSQATLARATEAHHSWLHQLGKSLGSANVSGGAANLPGAYPPDMGPKPGHVYVP